MTARVSIPFCEPSSRLYRHLLQNAGVCVYECVEWRWEWGPGAESWVRVPLHCASAALDLHAGRVGKLQSSPPGDRHREGLSAEIVAPSRYLQSAAPPPWGPGSTCPRLTAEEEEAGAKPSSVVSVRLLASTARGSVEEGRPGRSPEPPRGCKF